VVAMLGTIVQAVRANGQIDGSQPSPFYDSPFYDAYVCADGRFITICALEPKFYAALLNKLAARRRRPSRTIRSQSVAPFEGTVHSALRKLPQ
jgi:alpha-methylacyl-CoA racemase